MNKLIKAEYTGNARSIALPFLQLKTLTSGISELQRATSAKAAKSECELWIQNLKMFSSTANFLSDYNKIALESCIRKKPYQTRDRPDKSIDSLSLKNHATSAHLLVPSFTCKLDLESMEISEFRPSRRHSRHLGAGGHNFTLVTY